MEDKDESRAMDEKLKLALGALGAAVPLGILGDALLRASPWGLNALVWMLAAVGLALWLVRARKVVWAGEGRWLLIAAVAFAASLAWRDSGTLKLLSVLATLAALALAAFRSRRGRVVVAGVCEYAVAALWAALHAALGLALLLLGDIRWEAVPREGVTRKVLALGRGLAVAAPVLLLFTGLFMAADAVFEGIVTEILDVDFQELFTHVLLIGVWTWLAGGLLRALLLAEPLEVPAGRRLLSLGIVETAVLLVLVDALFLAFVAVQLRYLFGGAALVEVSAGLTYAEYARRGFFELVTAAALALPLLLLLDGLLRRDTPRAEPLFRILAGFLLVLLFLVLASAFQRMRVYHVAYGLTEMRLYTTAFMGWLALVCVWFLATVLPGRPERFAFGALVAGFVTLAALHALDPDRLIAKVNTSRAASGKTVDSAYLSSLGADSVPTLVSALPSLPPEERCTLADRLVERWSPPDEADWRTWSVSRARAWRVVGENAEALRAMACPPPALRG